MQAAFSKPGAYNCMFTGWSSMNDMLEAGKLAYPQLAHICIWSKTNGGLGAPWRNAWEGILVYRVKGGKTQNNVMLGKHGRNRTDVFQYAGVNTFRAGRMEELQSHPTCKPVALLADLILDITPIRGIVLDVFLGSGSTILAAHETERRGIGIELDPRYVDVAIGRLEKAIGKPAIHHSGRTFAELAADRAADNEGEL
jgi:DNA modification methylase